METSHGSSRGYFQNGPGSHIFSDLAPRVQGLTLPNELIAVLKAFLDTRKLVMHLVLVLCYVVFCHFRYEHIDVQMHRGPVLELREDPEFITSVWTVSRKEIDDATPKNGTSTKFLDISTEAMNIQGIVEGVEAWTCISESCVYNFQRSCM